MSCTLHVRSFPIHQVLHVTASCCLIWSDRELQCLGMLLMLRDEHSQLISSHNHSLIIMVSPVPSLRSLIFALRPPTETCVTSLTVHELPQHAPSSRIWMAANTRKGHCNDAEEMRRASRRIGKVDHIKQHLKSEQDHESKAAMTPERLLVVSA